MNRKKDDWFCDGCGKYRIFDADTSLCWQFKKALFDDTAPFSPKRITYQQKTFGNGYVYGLRKEFSDYYQAEYRLDATRYIPAGSTIRVENDQYGTPLIIASRLFREWL